MTSALETCIKEARNLPRGSELWVGHKYLLMAEIIEAKERLWFWQFSRRKLYNIILQRLVA